MILGSLNHSLLYSAAKKGSGAVTANCVRKTKYSFNCIPFLFSLPAMISKPIIEVGGYPAGWGRAQLQKLVAKYGTVTTIEIIEAPPTKVFQSPKINSTSGSGVRRPAKKNKNWAGFGPKNQRRHHHLAGRPKKNIVDIMVRKCMPTSVTSGRLPKKKKTCGHQAPAARQNVDIRPQIHVDITTSKAKT